MNKVTKVTTAALAAIIMLGGSVVANPTDVQASATYKRSKITKVKKANYYSIKNAKTYKMTGSAKKLKLKASHNLKNYKKSTWVRTKKTTIKKNGKKALYYYVTSQKNGDKGWVWHKYLKAGKNYQMANAKSLASKNYIKAKSGKIYQLQGSNKYMKFTNGKAISAKKTYKVTQQRHIYKNGKIYKYYYVTSGNTAGWAWNKYFKAGTYNAPTKKVTNSSSGTKLTSGKTYNTSTVNSAMISSINSYRSQQGVGNLVVDAKLQQIAEQRAPQLEVNFSHEDANGNYIAGSMAEKLGIYDTYYGAEDITEGGIEATNALTAKSMVDNYKGSAPHWYNIMGSAMTKIGVATFRASDGTLYNVIELGY